MADHGTYSEEHIEHTSMRPFFIIWGGQSFSLFGSQIVQFALIWWLTRETDSATILALATMLMILPRLLFSPFVGALIDRLNRRRVMIVADSLIAALILLLALLFALGVAQIWHVYLVIFLRSVGEIFHRPAMTASTSLMVPKKHLSRVSGINQTLVGTLQVATPALGALLVDLLPMQGVLAIDIVTAIIAVVPLFFVQIPQPDLGEAAGQKVSVPLVLSDMRAGLKALVSWRGIFLMVLVYTVVHLFFTPSMSIMPILVIEHFQGGALELGWLQSAIGVGLALGGVLLGVWGGHKRRIVTSMMGLTMIGVSITVIGITPAGAYPLALVAMLFLGVSLTFVTGLRMAIWQAVIPPEYQGRVFSLMSAIMAVLDIAGLAIVGPMTDQFGPQLSYILCGIATILLGISTFFIPAIMRVEEKTAKVAPAVKGV